MSRTKVASDQCSFCYLRPHRHDLCPRTITHAGGQTWECRCADASHASADTRKRRVVKV